MIMKMISALGGKPQDRNGVITPNKKTPEELEKMFNSRRSFLKVSGVTALSYIGSGIFSEEVLAKDNQEVFKNNKIGVRKMTDWLNTHDEHILKNPKADGNDIYNSEHKLIEDYDAGKFQSDKTKYYKPKTFENRKIILSKYKNIEKDFLEKEELVKLNLKADFIIVAEIQGTNKNKDLNTKGFAVLEKGTPILTREVNGKRQNYIESCFNEVYASAPLCCPCTK